MEVKEEHKKHAGGRPTKYNPDILAKMLLLSRRGFTDEEIGQIVGISEDTVTEWKKKPEFSLPLKCNKKLADAIVERSLYERAIGYSHPEVHISNYQGEITQTPIIKHYPPDVTAQIFWLKNRQPALWRESPLLDLSTHYHITHEYRTKPKTTTGSIRSQGRPYQSSQSDPTAHS